MNRTGSENLQANAAVVIPFCFKKGSLLAFEKSIVGPLGFRSYRPQNQRRWRSWVLVSRETYENLIGVNTKYI